jgi:hypothetical protein
MVAGFLTIVGKPHSGMGNNLGHGEPPIERKECAPALADPMPQDLRRWIARELSEILTLSSSKDFGESAIFGSILQL